MAAQRECLQHPGRPLMLFCGKCLRPVCPSCLIQQAACPVAATQQHEFTELENMPVCLRNQLDSIQVLLCCEQNVLLDRAKSFASDAERREDEFSSQVERVLQNRDEALQVIQQLQTSIRAAAASAIASVLRAGVESDGGKQNVEDVHARALACRQQSNTITRLLNLDDASLLNEIEFVRNLVRCTEPPAASSNPPAPSLAVPSLGSRWPASNPHLPTSTQLVIEVQLKNILQPMKGLIQSLKNIVEVC